MPHLFEPFTIGDLTLKNRIVMSPMCMYSADETATPNDWHFVHYGSRAVGGVGLIIVEATAVESRGRLSENDLGLYDPAQVAGHQRVVAFCHRHGAKIGVQLAHGGRKAFSDAKAHGPEPVVAPSAEPFADGWATPGELSQEEIQRVVAAFGRGAEMAAQAGYDLIEIHGAHGYLIHEFLSPLSNHRADAYGGSPEARRRFALEVIAAIRRAWPKPRPLFMRISATDWAEGGLSIDDQVENARAFKEAGVDLIDASSGGVISGVRIPIGPGYQVPLAEKIRREAHIPTAAVGLITEPEQADTIIRTGQADLVCLARELLRDPYWPLAAAHQLGHDVDWPVQYQRAKR